MILLVIYSVLILIFPELVTWEFLGLPSPLFGIILNVLLYFFLILIGIYYRLDETTLTSKEITLIAIYSAFTAVARIPFVALPNVQPCSFLIFSAGIAFGPLIGFMIGANTAVISNMFLGQGPWTIYQIIAWGLIGIVGGLFHNLRKKLFIRRNLYLMASIGFVLGFIYGAIMNVWSWMLNPPLTLLSFLVLYTSSFFFDLAHALSNFLFILYFGERVVNILNRYHDRFFLRKLVKEEK